MLPLALVSAQLKAYGDAVDLRELIDSITNVTGLVFGAFAVVCFIIAGILFLTSSGDSAKLTKAKDALIWGIVGVVVGILAFSIIYLVSNLIQGSY